MLSLSSDWFPFKNFFLSYPSLLFKGEFSPFLVSRCHRCWFECQNFFLWSKLSDFFIWKIQTFSLYLKVGQRWNAKMASIPKFVRNFIFILLLISRCVYYLRIINICIQLSYSWLYQIGHKYSYWSSWIEKYFSSK